MDVADARTPLQDGECAQQARIVGKTAVLDPVLPNATIEKLGDEDDRDLPRDRNHLHHILCADLRREEERGKEEAV
ncbi:8611_t:CDS:2 [Paraglomus occultum]|uniref:8611_t:CDS:1 n=1 Tax=Paraglomus occultum TaxID=144539 RepID=A0A9N9BVQ1_9GLOM|nr:8611_t:CDS:2 [Paraglomus occultum]